MTIGVDTASFKEFLRFSSVGVLGFLVNLASVYALKSGLGLYWAGIAAFAMAATVTWAANRAFTFRDRARRAAARQWVVYLGANLVGFGLYFTVYGGLIALVPICRFFPVLPLGVASIVGLFSNFTLSRHLVFR